jgi:hypothetical protein
MTNTWKWTDHHGVVRHLDYCQRKDTGEVFAVREIRGMIMGAYGPLTLRQLETVDLLDFPYDDAPELVAWLCDHPGRWGYSVHRWTNPDGSRPF